MESENVKEKLNTLLHKKILDQHEKEIKEEAVENMTPVRVKQENEYSNENTQFVDPEVEQQQQPVSPEDRFKHISLHEILNEKKKALLQNKEVIDFLNGRAK